MKQIVTVSNALVCAILDGSGIDDSAKLQLLAHAGLAERAVRDITARTSIVRLARLWRCLLAITQDAHVGLRIGSTLRSERFGLGAQAAQHGGDTFRQVLLRFAKYATLVNDLLECRLEETPPSARFTARLHWNVLGLERHAVDITLAGVARFARDRLAAPLAIHRVQLKHSLTASEPRYREIFMAPINFGANRYELVFDAAALDEPVGSDRELGQLLDSYANLELSRIPIVTGFPARVAQIVRNHLELGTSPDLLAIAAELATPPRSLQRQLRDHATSFSAIVDEARRALAPDWLADPTGNVEQVGFRLGYSEPTAFIRAFKKWYGVTPGVFRRDKLRGA